MSGWSDNNPCIHSNFPCESDFLSKRVYFHKKQERKFYNNMKRNSRVKMRFREWNC